MNSTASSPFLESISSRISASCGLTLAKRASNSSTSIRGNCLRISSATSEASRSGRLRSSSTLSQGNCSSLARACAPPTASSLSDSANSGSSFTRCRSDASALAIRMRVRLRRKVGVAMAAICALRFSRNLSPMLQLSFRSLVLAGKVFRPPGKKGIALEAPKPRTEFHCKDWCYVSAENTVLPRRGTTFRRGTEIRSAERATRIAYRLIATEL